MPSENGTKALLQKLMIWALAIIVGLVSTVFAITWTTTDRKATDNAKAVTEIKTFIAQQQEINKNIEKRLDEILVELKK